MRHSTNTISIEPSSKKKKLNLLKDENTKQKEKDELMTNEEERVQMRLNTETQMLIQELRKMYPAHKCKS